MKENDLYHLIWMSRPLMQAAETLVERGLANTDLTVRMRAVLEMLHQHGDLTVPDIAARIEIKRQYVQVMVNEARASGFLKQVPNPRHKRSPLLTLTDPGRALISSVIMQERALMQDLGTDLNAEDVSTALKVVMAVTAKLKMQGDTGA